MNLAGKNNEKSNKFDKTDTIDKGLKYEIAMELGLMDKIRRVGWAGLTAKESGRIGGLITARTKKRNAVNDNNECR